MKTTHIPNGFYHHLAESALNAETLTRDACLRVLEDPNLELLPLLHAAYTVRHRFFGRHVRVHILNNLQNGYCPEDCNYCAQAAGSKSEINKYRIKSDSEILEGAERASRSGAFRYCMVLSGRGPDGNRVEHMARLVRRIKADFPLQVCLSAGFIDQKMALALKEAGLDRYNHNLNTSEDHYDAICKTHTFQDRLSTLEAAREAGLEVCSGIIIGMGEDANDILTVARTLKSINARSIPVNFYVHVPGSQLGAMNTLSPEKCLRTLCLFRFVNPDAEIRAAGGREANLGFMEPLSLYPANSLFSEGYLNTGGHANERTLRMIREAGFELESIQENGEITTNQLLTGAHVETEEVRP